ncbi:MAG: hypothetical protein IKI75_01580 [Lachnospiraceae bacterium]|nr:hypothetical protein [Lachnospiraceae bacterium]
MRKTKIICTIGPASAGEEILTRMCRSGMNVARLNFSHGTHEEHLEQIRMIKKVREKLGYPLPIMLDTKGPEYRIGDFKIFRGVCSKVISSVKLINPICCLVLLTGGQAGKQSGSTNTIRLETIK